MNIITLSEARFASLSGIWSPTRLTFLPTLSRRLTLFWQNPFG